jgi:hypothetical protein
MDEILSETPDVGKVFLCSKCSDVHVSVGQVTMTLPEASFFRLADLLRSAADHPRLYTGRRGHGVESPSGVGDVFLKN